jgi:uncharacterized protein YutE (UPF0331/DUF86 family)
MVDPGRLRSLLDRMGEEVEHLRRLSAIAPEELLADPDRLAGVKYRFVVAIETCIDTAQHVIASEGLRAPSDFADAFAVLGEAGVLPPELVPVLGEMARFRDLLVHGYLQVDDRRVLEILRSRLGDFDAFREHVARSALDADQR